MSSDLPIGIDAGMMDDFFCEADEHLLGIRQTLHQLETSLGGGVVDARALETIFQHFHSFKGISAIVGLGLAEMLAHTAEDLLRLVRSKKIRLTVEALHAVDAAAQKLEQMVGAFRHKTAQPDSAETLAELKRFCTETTGAPAAAQPAPESQVSGDVTVKIREARSRGMRVWNFAFTPSPELNARGVTLESTRREFAELGEVLHSAPHVPRPGVVQFEFYLALRSDPSDESQWKGKGVTFEVVPEEASPAGVEESSPAAFLSPSHVVRVDLKRLDDLMRIAGDLIIERSHLDVELARLNGGVQRGRMGQVDEVNNRLGRSLRELCEGIMEMRMVPVAEIFSRLPFVVRDLARQGSKKARLVLTGQNTEIDKYLVERLKDPLLHLVRNAFSHGVETPKERAARGKPEEATIELSAASMGDSVFIKVRDDGNGIVPQRITEKAGQMGIPVPDVIDNEALLKILCHSGFSTRDEADRAAGRGVGMAVVYSTVRELGGSLTLDSTPGQGTQFTLRLPLTLAIAEALIVSAAGQTCALPQSCVRELFHATEQQVETVNGIEALPYRGAYLPVLRLAKIFGLRGSERKVCVLVIESERGTAGLITDAVLAQREVVVRGLPDPLIQVAFVAGVTELGDGKPVLILDGSALTSGHLRPHDRPAPASGQSVKNAA